MEEIKIKCPSCGKALKVKATSGLQGKRITCPACKQSNLYEDYIPNIPKGGTTIPLAPPPSAADPGALVDCNTGMRYPLAVGRNYIGRPSPSSTATLQIPSADHKLSRRHAIIDVQDLGNGMFQRSIQNWENTNPTRINEELLPDGDVNLLMGGEIIQMANITFRLEV